MAEPPIIRALERASGAGARARAVGADPMRPTVVENVVFFPRVFKLMRTPSYQTVFGLILGSAAAASAALPGSVFRPKSALERCSIAQSLAHAALRKAGVLSKRIQADAHTQFSARVFFRPQTRNGQALHRSMAWARRRRGRVAAAGRVRESGHIARGPTPAPPASSLGAYVCGVSFG